jgi:hypothetical protein
MTGWALALVSTPPTVSDGTVWHVLLFVILPLLALYAGLVWYGFTNDRWKR